MRAHTSGTLDIVALRHQGADKEIERKARPQSDVSEHKTKRERQS